MSTSRGLKRLEITDEMLSQAVELIKLDEKDLYERLGLSLKLWESSQSLDFEVRDFEREKLRYIESHKARTRPIDDYYLNQFRMTQQQFKRILSLLTLRESLIKDGKKYFRKFRKDLFQKICVEKEACKWSKEILGDANSLLREIIPLVGIILGLTVQAIVITVAIIIVKWGIIKFCKCPKP